jgi:hypothetical protein
MRSWLAAAVFVLSGVVGCGGGDGGGAGAQETPPAPGEADL